MIKYYSKIVTHPLNTHLEKEFTTLKIIAPFRSIINQDWYLNLTRKYAITTRFLTDITFIFLRTLFNLIKQSNFNLLRYNQEIINNCESILLKNNASSIRFDQKYNHPTNPNSGPTFIYYQELITQIFEYLLQKQSDNKKLTPIRQQEFINTTIKSILQKQSEYQRQEPLKLFKINKIIQNLQSNLTSSFPKISQLRLQFGKVSKQKRSNTLQYLKFDQNMFNRLLSSSKTYNWINEAIQSTTRDFSTIKYLVDIPGDVEAKKSDTILYNSPKPKDEINARESMIYNLANFNNMKISKDILFKNFFSSINAIPKAALQNIFVSSCSESPQLTDILNLKEQNLIFSAFDNRIELAHTRPASSSVPVLAREIPQYIRLEEKESQRPKIESKYLLEEFRQEFFKSPVINRIADQVSNVLERRLFLERERRGF